MIQHQNIYLLLASRDDIISTMQEPHDISHMMHAHDWFKGKQEEGGRDREGRGTWGNIQKNFEMMKRCQHNKQHKPTQMLKHKMTQQHKQQKRKYVNWSTDTFSNAHNRVLTTLTQLKSSTFQALSRSITPIQKMIKIDF